MSWWPQRCEKLKDTGEISKEEAMFFEASWEATESTEKWRGVGARSLVRPGHPAPGGNEWGLRAALRELLEEEDVQQATGGTS